MKFWLPIIALFSTSGLAVSLIVAFGLPSANLLNGVDPYARDVKGQVVLQSRTSFEGVEVILVSKGEPISITNTDAQGFFGFFMVPEGLVGLRFFFPGYLRDSREVQVLTGEVKDIGKVKLPGGDADLSNEINSNDLRLIGAGIAAESQGMAPRSPSGNLVTPIPTPPPPPPPVFRDINGDGQTDALDLALAGVNFGRKGN